MLNKIVCTIKRINAGGQEETLNNIALNVQGFSFTNNISLKKQVWKQILDGALTLVMNNKIKHSQVHL